MDIENVYQDTETGSVMIECNPNDIHALYDMLKLFGYTVIAYPSGLVFVD